MLQIILMMPGLSSRNIRIVLGRWISVLPLGIFFLFGLSIRGQVIETTWTGGTSNWNNAGNWSGGVVPNNSASEYKVLIDGGTTGTNSVVSIDISPTITGFAIDSGDTLGLNNARSLSLQSSGTYTNDGTLSMNSTGTNTQLAVSGGTVSIGGTGAITLSDRTSNRIIGVGFPAVLELGSGQSLSGAGQIGANSMGLTNRGAIEADGTASLTIDPNISGVLNTGTIKATGSGGLVLGTGTYTNFEGADKGTIEAAGALLKVNNATVNGGILKVTGAGTLEVVNGTVNADELTIPNTGTLRLNGGTINGGAIATLAPILLEATGANTIGGATVTNPVGGEIRINNGSGLALEASGTYTNEGNITLNSTGTNTQLAVSGGTVSIGGTGAITLSDRTSNRIIGVGFPAVLELGSGQSLSGAGQIGANSMGLTNRGAIEADGTASLTIDPNISGVLNTGTIKATGSGGLVLNGGIFTNFEGALDGTIEAAGATVTLSGATVNGGTVKVTGAGTVKLSSATISGSTLSNSATGLLETTGGVSTIGATVTNPVGGEIRIGNATDLILEASGTYTNHGTLSINSTGSTTQLKVSGGTVTIGGTGAITLSDRTANRIIGVASTDVLELGSGQSLSGAGQIGANFMGLINRGLINATGTNTLTINLTGTAAFTNEGTLRATGAGGLVFTEALTNTGTLKVGLGSKATITGNYVQTFGSTLVDGTLDPSGLVDIQGGSLSGSGTILADVTNAGFLSPGNSPGILTINGALTLQPTSVISFELGGTLQGDLYDSINVLGDLNLNGDIDVLFIDGFQSTISGSDNFILMSATTLAGAFGAVPNGTRFAIDGGYSFILNYGVGSPFSANQVVLTGFIIPEPSTYALWLGMILFVVVMVRRRIDTQ